MKFSRNQKIFTNLKNRLPNTTVIAIIAAPIILFFVWIAWLLGSIRVATNSLNFFIPILIILGIGLFVGLTGGPRN